MTEPYYRDELVTLYHADCREVLPELSGVDLIVTSPPYNLGGVVRPGGWDKRWAAAPQGIVYADHTDDMPEVDYVAWQHMVLALMWGTLSERGAIYYNHKPRIRRGELWNPLTLNPGLPLRQIVIWDRAGQRNFNEIGYANSHEWLVIFAKPAFRLLDRTASGVGDVWRIPQTGDPDHPAHFPIGIPARAIDTTAPALVADPFAGSGTTLRAAKDAGVAAVGCEISERYCEKAAARLVQDTLPGVHLWGSI